MLDAVSLAELVEKMTDLVSGHTSVREFLSTPRVNTRESEITCRFIRLVEEMDSMQKRISEYARELYSSMTAETPLSMKKNRILFCWIFSLKAISRVSIWPIY